MQTTTLLMLSSALAALEQATAKVKTDTNGVIESGDHLELVRHFSKLREVNEAIKKARKELNDLEDHLSYTDIPDAFRKARVKTITIDDVGRVTISYKWTCSILDGKKPEAFQWLRDGGNGAIIIETVPWQSLAAFAKQETEAFGRDMPDNLFKTGLNPYTSITKA